MGSSARGRKVEQPASYPKAESTLRKRVPYNDQFGRFLERKKRRQRLFLVLLGALQTGLLAVFYLALVR